MPLSSESLKTIRFEGELLPNWAQLLDVAAGICAVSQETRAWFSRFANAPGVEDARTVILQCDTLLSEMRHKKETVLSELARTHGDQQPSRIFAAWEYTLETMLQAARSQKTCSWHIEGAEQTGEGDFGSGNITLRRV